MSSLINTNIVLSGKIGFPFANPYPRQRRAEFDNGAIFVYTENLIQFTIQKSVKPQNNTTSFDILKESVTDYIKKYQASIVQDVGFNFFFLERQNYNEFIKKVINFDNLKINNKMPKITQQIRLSYNMDGLIFNLVISEAKDVKEVAESKLLIEVNNHIPINGDLKKIQSLVENIENTYEQTKKHLQEFLC